MVLEILHRATHREPVDVHVRYRHKDRDLHHLLLEIFIVGDYLGDHHTTIAGREYKLRVVNLHTAWLAKEGCYKEPEDEQEACHEPHDGNVRIDE